MKKKYDLSDELTPAQIEELRRRLADSDDVTRYLLVSRMTPRFALYYNVSDDVYVMNDARGATLFKRREAALAVKRLLSSSNVEIVRCKSKRISGVRVPVLGPTRPGKASKPSWLSNKRLPPPARAKRRVRRRLGSAGRG